MYERVIDEVFGLQQAGIDIDPASYDYFTYRDRPVDCNIYLELVKSLTRKCILDNPMGDKKYFPEVFNLSMHDLLECDLATFIEYEEMADDMAEEHLKELQERGKVIDKTAKET